MKKIGHQLKEIRKRRGITQELLADAAGVDVTTIRRAERGDVGPVALNKIATALGLKVTIFLESTN